VIYLYVLGAKKGWLLVLHLLTLTHNFQQSVLMLSPLSKEKVYKKDLMIMKKLMHSLVCFQVHRIDDIQRHHGPRRGSTKTSGREDSGFLFLVYRLWNKVAWKSRPCFHTKKYKYMDGIGILIENKIAGCQLIPIFL